MFDARTHFSFFLFRLYISRDILHFTNARESIWFHSFPLFTNYGCGAIAAAPSFIFITSIFRLRLCHNRAERVHYRCWKCLNRAKKTVLHVACVRWVLLFLIYFTFYFVTFSFFDCSLRLNDGWTMNWLQTRAREERKCSLHLPSHRIQIVTSSKEMKHISFRKQQL